VAIIVDVDAIANEKWEALELPRGDEAPGAELVMVQVDPREKLVRELAKAFATNDTTGGLIVTLPDSVFVSGQTRISPSASTKLKALADVLRAHPELAFEIRGHTDSFGSEEVHLRLSEQRATAVGDYLLEQGLPASAVSARGFGKSQPVTTNDTPAGRAQNRRVEIVISGDPAS
jgi:outer membrane protein OmpA-like peptidoglycan-associated protein